MSQPFRVTKVGAIGGPGGSPGSEGGRSFEIETRSESDEVDRVSISPEGNRLAEMVGSSEGADNSDSKQSETDDSPKSRFERVTGAGKAKSDEDSSEVEGEDSKEVSEKGGDSSKTVISDGKKVLSTEEEEEVRELKRRDREVRTHEMAHKAAAGSLASGGPVYEVETGPDGRQYAVGGHVSIRIPKGRTPSETIRIAQQAKRAALAPASPSGQDRSVAVEAQSRVQKAQKKLSQDQVEQFNDVKIKRRPKVEQPEQIKENPKSSTEPSSQFEKGMEGVQGSEFVSDAPGRVGFEPVEGEESAKAKSITDAYNQINDFSDELAMAGCNSCRQFACGCAIA